MQRNRRSFGLVILLLLLALAAWWLLGRLAQVQPGIRAFALTPAPTPADARTVAVLRLEITSDADGEVAEVVIFMLTRPRGMTIRDVVMLPTHFDL